MNLIRKGLAVAVIVLFVGMSVPSTGRLMSDDDITPPVTTHSLSPEAPDGDSNWYVNDVILTLESTDDLSGVDFIKYLLDDNNWTIYSDPITVSNDGHHRITYYAVDKAGNVEEPCEVVRFKQDKTEPYIKKVNAKFYREPPKSLNVYARFICNAQDNTSGMKKVEMYINQGINDTIVGPGPTYRFDIRWFYGFRKANFSFIYYDIAGNIAENSISVDEIKIDTQSNIFQNPFNPVAMHIEDNIHIEKKDNRLNKINNINIGDNDTTPPITTHLIIPEFPDGKNGWYIKDVTIKIESKDDYSGVEYIKFLIDDFDWEQYKYPFDVSWDGYHCLTYYAVDKAGNVEEPCEVVRFNSDQTIPEIKEVEWEAYKDRPFGNWKVKYICHASDKTSGMDKVEMCLNNGIIGTVIGEGPTYEFTLNWSETFKYVLFSFIHYDKAGWFDIDTIEGWPISLECLESTHQSSHMSSNLMNRNGFFGPFLFKKAK